MFDGPCMPKPMPAITMRSDGAIGPAAAERGRLDDGRERGGPREGERSRLEELTPAESTLLVHRVLWEVSGRAGAAEGII